MSKTSTSFSAFAHVHRLCQLQKSAKAFVFAVFMASNIVMAGTVGGGGGDTLYCNPSDVEATVKDLRFRFSVILGMFDDIDIFNPKYVSDSNLKRALQRVRDAELAENLGLGTGLSEELHSLDLKSAIKAEPECKNTEGKLHFAATKFRRGSPICFSVTKLSRLRKKELDLQMVALAAHELLHHFQPEPASVEEASSLEAEADALQRFIMNIFGDFDFDQNSPYPFRTSGSYKILLKAGSVKTNNTTVFCYEPGNGLSTADVQIAPGNSVVIGGGEKRASQPDTVYCLDLPARDCRISPAKKIGAEPTSKIFVGDVAKTTFYDWAVNDELTRLKKAHICKDQ